MSRVDRLVILTHRQLGLDRGHFLARMKRLVWDAEGRKILVHQGLRSPPEAEVVGNLAAGLDSLA